MSTNKLFSRLRLPPQGRMPAFTGTTDWLNASPLAPTDLHGRVVAAQFWTFTCINWIRTLPYVRAWADTYTALGLVVVGVHTPEFGVEHDIDNIRRAARDLRVEYPIAVDNDYAVWDAFANQYWPALYVADSEGRIRHHHFGEGAYERSESAIRHLLVEAGAAELPDAPLVEAHGIELAADWDNLRSPETYLGAARSRGNASRGGIALDEPRAYGTPSQLEVDEWALSGRWTFGPEEVVNNEAGARIAFRFHARDLNLILVPPTHRPSAGFRVMIDGRAPGAAHGVDSDDDGHGVVDEARLYQLIRQPGHITDRLFELELTDPGVAALCFTFG